MKFKIGTPCTERLVNIGRRDSYCDKCNKTVYDLSSRTKAGALWLLLRQRGKLCGIINYRRDGSPVFRELTPRSFGRMFRNALTLLPFAGLCYLSFTGKVHAADTTDGLNGEQYQTYGDVRLAEGIIIHLIAFVEGSLGAITLLLSFVSSFVLLVLAGFKKSKKLLIMGLLFALFTLGIFYFRQLLNAHYDVDPEYEDSTVAAQ